MKNLEQIYEIIEEEGILLEEVNLTYKYIEGIYLKLPGLPSTIGINKSICNNSKKLLSVLAEELGHHFTSFGDLTTECFTYSDEIKLSKQEKKARLWAANFLISDEEFVQALSYDITSLYDLSEHFYVTEEIIRYKFYSISICEKKSNNINKILLYANKSFSFDC
ncbi:ImmA/IrrE family metallo-endopeptidase [Clostridium sp. BSD9I1]|uniref:ImmA/IrrE family metallo-endopeptidase n=1 Tax=Clostridium sp. BSD9I1 TaxID=2003589 RepID=UPI0016475B1C|nr:ImmA/IrrE family metallo-endopeptidase [Clostridium sp. BSD9I1]